jgi:integrase
MLQFIALQFNQLALFARSGLPDVFGRPLFGQKKMPKSALLYAPKLVKGATWYVEYYIELQGKRKRIRKSQDQQGRELNAIEDLAERERMAERMCQELRALITPLSQRKEDMPFVEALDLAVELKRSDSEATNKTFTETARWVKEYFVDRGWRYLRCSQLTFDHVQDYFDHCIVKRRVSNTTYNTRKNNLRSLVSELKERGYVPENFVKRVKNRPKTETRRRPMSEEEKQIVYRHVLGDRALSLAWLLLGYLAIRPKEMRNLKCGAIDLKRGVVRFPAKESKNRRHSVVTIPAGILPALASFELEKQPASYYVFGNDEGRGVGKANRDLLPGPKRIGVNTLGNKFRTLLRELKREGKLHDITGLSLYSLKDTLAIYLLDQGVDVESAMQHFRHNSLEMFQRYVRRLGMVNEKIRALEIDLPAMAPKKK